MRKFAIALLAALFAVAPIQMASAQTDCSAARVEVRDAGEDAEKIAAIILANEACVGELMKVVARKNADLVTAVFSVVLDSMSPAAAREAAAAIVAVAPARTIVAALGVAMDKNDGNGGSAAPILVVTPTSGGGSSSSTSTTSVSGSPS